MKFTILLLLFLAFARVSALACTCSSAPPVSEALAQAKVVFAGRCISSQVVTKELKPFGSFHVQEFTFEVTRAWKGVADKKQITVETGMGGGDCGYSFQVNVSYIVYCQENKGVLTTSICTRNCNTETQPKAEQEMKELDEAKSKTKSK